MKWLEINVSVDKNVAGEIATALGKHCQDSIAIEEQVDSSEKMTCIVRAYLPCNRSGSAKKKALLQSLKQLSSAYPVQIEERVTEPEDWLSAWKSHFGVLEIGERLVIKPSWLSDCPIPPDKIVIQIDPGMAFGTGLHSTTRLCLLGLQSQLKPGMSVLDLGTGSGILAIAATKMGASSVLALDTDPTAVKVAEENVNVNGVAGIVQVRKGTLNVTNSKKLKGRFALAVANITSRAISDSARSLARVLKPSGKLIVSGITTDGLDMVLISLAVVGFTIESIACDKEWYAVYARNS